MDAEAASARRRAYEVCRDYLHGAWELITAEQMLFKPISGGLSNLLYLCELPANERPLAEEPSRALLRLYGQAHEGVSHAAITESVIFTLLAERALGPRLYAVFPGGRLEEFIPARSVSTCELREPTTSAQIARHVATVHSLQVPICKQPTALWHNMKQWLQISRKTLSDKVTDNGNAHIITEFRRINFDLEIDWLKQYFQAAPSPVVFCHNDVQEGNVLRHVQPPDGSNPENPGARGTSTPLTLIDFEYCSYGHRAFDIANHFCEWMYDYEVEEFPNFKETPADWPSREQQLFFIRAYLQYRNSLQQQTTSAEGQTSSQSAATTESGDKERLQRQPSRQLSTEDEAETILDEVRVYTLGSHLFWTLWSMVNAATSSIAFGYWEYGLCRLRAYRRLQRQLAASDPRCPPLVAAYDSSCGDSCSGPHRSGHGQQPSAEPCAVHGL